MKASRWTRSVIMMLLKFITAWKNIQLTCKTFLFPFIHTQNVCFAKQKGKYNVSEHNTELIWTCGVCGSMHWLYRTHCVSLLEHGFVDVKPAQLQNVSAKLQENVELRVDFEAYPPPHVRWTKDGASIKGDKTVVVRHEHEIRSSIQPSTNSLSLFRLNN